MDFIDRLCDSVLYPLPGGQVEREFYDGIKDQVLNYEF